MDKSYYFMHIGALMSVGPFIWFGGEMVSCYFPFLLSAKYYCVIKNPLLCKILISTQLNRSPKSKTRIEDRNKLPLIALIYYIIGMILLVAFVVSDLCAVIQATKSEVSSTIQFLAPFAPYSIIGMMLLAMLSALSYWIDYSVGKYINVYRKRNNS